MNEKRKSNGSVLIERKPSDKEPSISENECWTNLFRIVCRNVFGEKEKLFAPLKVSSISQLSTEFLNTKKGKFDIEYVRRH